MSLSTQYVYNLWGKKINKCVQNVVCPESDGVFQNKRNVQCFYSTTFSRRFFWSVTLDFKFDLYILLFTSSSLKRVCPRDLRVLSYNCACKSRLLFHQLCESYEFCFWKSPFRSLLILNLSVSVAHFLLLQKFPKQSVFLLPFSLDISTLNPIIGRNNVLIMGFSVLSTKTTVCSRAR